MPLIFSPAHLQPTSGMEPEGGEAIPYKVPVDGCNIVRLQDKKILAGEDGDMSSPGVDRD